MLLPLSKFLLPTTKTDIAMLKMGIRGPLNKKHADPNDRCCVCGCLIGNSPSDMLTWRGWPLCSNCFDSMGLEDDNYDQYD
jgi:hypothetical protein